MNATTKNILFVCTANLCRSPMAEGLLKAQLESKPGRPNWIVESAGTWGENGLPATANAIEVMKARKIDISQHKSRIVDPEIIQQANLILVMEANHKEALHIEFPDERNRILMLSELIDQHYDIEDPMGESLARFEQTASELERILSEGFDQIERFLARGD